MAYAGKDRRVHKVLVTRNTEYHMRGRTCVAVRDRRTGEWLRAHLALRSEVSGGLRFKLEGGIVPVRGVPSIGESAFFRAEGRDLVTSTILSVERPPKRAVASYAA